MIYIFNETNLKKWEITSKNDYFFRIELIGTHFGIDILKRDMEEDAFFTNVLESNMNETSATVQVLSCASFAVCYNNKSGLPFLKPIVNGNEFTQDLYILTYRIPEGMEIINEHAGKFAVQYSKYDKNNGLLHVIGVGKPVNYPLYFLTFADASNSNFVTKHMVNVKKTSMVQVFIQKYTKEEVEASDHKAIIIGKGEKTKVSVAKVIYPYSVIVYPFANEEFKKEILEGRFNKDPEHTHYFDQQSKSLFTELKKINNKKYNAATFYIDKPFEEITDEDMENVKYTNIFNKVNFISKNGRVKSL